MAVATAEMAFLLSVAHDLLPLCRRSTGNYGTNGSPKE
jgi:hypothetical protein